MQSVETITHKADIPNECPPVLPEWARDAGDGQFFLNGWVEDWDDVNCPTCLESAPPLPGLN